MIKHLKGSRRILNRGLWDTRKMISWLQLREAAKTVRMLGESLMSIQLILTPCLTAIITKSRKETRTEGCITHKGLTILIETPLILFKWTNHKSIQTKESSKLLLLKSITQGKDIWKSKASNAQLTKSRLKTVFFRHHQNIAPNKSNWLQYKMNLGVLRKQWFQLSCLSWIWGNSVKHRPSRRF